MSINITKNVKAQMDVGASKNRMDACLHGSMSRMSEGQYANGKFRAIMAAYIHAQDLMMINNFKK